MKSFILVFIQFFIIFLMTLPFGNEAQHLEVGLFVVVIGILIGWSAISKNKFGNFNIRPDIREECTLITDGIYSYIRHPMYTSVLVSMFGVMLIYLNSYEVVLYCILVVNMLIKMFYEEKLWHCNGEEYKAYAKTTKRLIPFVF